MRKIALALALIAGTSHGQDIAGLRDTAEQVVRELSTPSIGNKKSRQAPTKREEPTILDKLSAMADDTIGAFRQSGKASWYGREFHGKKTASGERFDMNAITAAHPTLPMNTKVLVTNHDNGKTAVVRINDRGPLKSSRILDLSYGAAEALGILQNGIGNITLERLN